MVVLIVEWAWMTTQKNAFAMAFLSRFVMIKTRIRRMAKAKAKRK
jgi:hypothetical protein